MKKSKTLYLVLFLTFSFLAYSFFKSERLKYMTKEEGILTTAEIYTRPICGRGSASVNVLIDERVLNVNIGINDCIKGVYSVGDVIDVIYCKDCGVAILPHTKVKVRYITSIIFFILPIYLLVVLLLPDNKKDNIY